MIRIPVSIGELLDKISILEIKSRRIRDESKLANVTHELNELQSVRLNGQAYQYAEQIQEAKANLELANEEIWNAINVLSMMDHRSDGAAPFALKIFEANKRRAALKREINELTGSDIIEEKDYG